MIDVNDGVWLADLAVAIYLVVFRASVRVRAEIGTMVANWKSISVSVSRGKKREQELMPEYSNYLAFRCDRIIALMQEAVKY